MQFLSTNEQRGRCPASADGEAQGNQEALAQTLQTARPEPYEKEYVRKDGLDLNETILALIEVMRGESRKAEVEPIVQLGHGFPPIQGDRVQLHQVMLNLMINALEAMSAANVGELNSSDPSLAGNRDPRRWRQLRTARIERLELRAERAHLR